MRRYARHVPTTDASTGRDRLSELFARGESGLREAYDAHGRLVYSICRRALDDEAAKDVTQEVFVSAWRGREQFDPSRGTLGAWLVGITKRRIVDHLRSEGRHANRRAGESAAEAGAPEDERIEQVVDQVVVADALRSLPSRTRQVIELAYVHDLTHHDIADETGLPLGTVKSDIRRGLLRIRHHMESTNG